MSLLLKDSDWSNKIMSCAPGEKINQLHCSVIPILNSYQFQESVAMVKNCIISKREIHFHNRRYFNPRLLLDVDRCFAKSSGYLLSAKYAMESQQMYFNINHHVFRSSKAHDCDGRKLTSTDNKNLQSLHNLVRTDQPYKLFKNSFVEAQTVALPCVVIRDKRIILQWHLLVVRAD